MARRNYYQLLGVRPDASREEIQSAYRRLARRYHPDVNAGGDAGARFNEVSDAYEVLHDPAQRARYDRSASTGEAAVTIDNASAAGDKTAAARHVPYFSSAPARRDVPRFVDREPGGVVVRFGGGRGVRVQLVMRWLR
jgi:DnaJ-class molecular chaperone